MMADKKRDQDYQDQMRNLNIAERKAKLNNYNRLSEEALNDKYRNQAYEDEIRKFKIAMSKGKSSRVNEYIDAELKKENAEADVTQSHADGIRNVTNGKHLSKSFFN